MKPLMIHNPHTRMNVRVLPSAQRRCDRCEGVMRLHKYWWSRQSQCEITWRCDCQQQTKLKTVSSTTTRTGELK